MVNGVVCSPGLFLHGDSFENYASFYGTLFADPHIPTLTGSDFVHAIESRPYRSPSRVVGSVWHSDHLFDLNHNIYTQISCVETDLESIYATHFVSRHSLYCELIKYWHHSLDDVVIELSSFLYPTLLHHAGVEFQLSSGIIKGRFNLIHHDKYGLPLLMFDPLRYVRFASECYTNDQLKLLYNLIRQIVSEIPSEASYVLKPGDYLRWNNNLVLHRASHRHPLQKRRLLHRVLSFE